MPIQDDHFSLFDLPARFALDERALEDAYRRVQTQVHPDRFAAGTAADRRVAMQWAARANEAVRTLRSPLRRAAYLCELNGIPVDSGSNTPMPAGFLAHQMTWREQLDEVRATGDRARLHHLRGEVDALRTATLRGLETSLDGSRDFRTAAGLVRQLMFIENFSHDLATVAEGVAGVDAG